MAKSLIKIKKDLRESANQEKAKGLARFFKTGKGEYAEGDKFLGVMVPQQREVVKKYWQEITMAGIKELIKSKFHEERLTGLLILVKKFQKGDQNLKKQIFDFYLANMRYINNWDLVDLTAPNIFGEYLIDKDKAILYKLAKSKILWERRIAILATFAFIKRGESQVALEIAEILVNDAHDLIQKAVGWMLREIGKRCSQQTEEEFLQKHAATMPRTMLRYAIEHFEESKRRYYLKK